MQFIFIWLKNQYFWISSMLIWQKFENLILIWIPICVILWKIFFFFEFWILISKICWIFKFCNSAFAIFTSSFFWLLSVSKKKIKSQQWTVNRIVMIFNRFFLKIAAIFFENIKPYCYSSFKTHYKCWKVMRMCKINSCVFRLFFQSFVSLNIIIIHSHKTMVTLFFKMIFFLV
jgi:hypothetical protein